ncbi:regulator of (H+)-ATPase in vacuolar membrane [Phytophthora boehmeriae]|uniref:Regulator of (H+)-ATPase in vacuolar membrane n=1 Tax=Phytophthora boehmeriae TaxID=109152 RepID=A0A8T1WZ83_9STRA|nr:regulator of (H+)-ATPase in vacuolar membrane [Phytophthora boehmeriae]
MALRSWSWTRIDGRNVLAVPTQTEIRLYDSDDFILLSRLAPSGHETPVLFVRWSFFHGKLASLSSSQILVHAPQRDQDERSSVRFAVICCYRLDEAHAPIRALAFSRNADELLFCGRNVGVGKLDVRSSSSNDYSEDQCKILWETSKGACDMAKFSPSAFVFATLTLKDVNVQVWRMARRLGDSDENQQLSRVETLEHPDPVVYFSWKPSTTQWHSVLETDGTRKAQEYRS